MRGISIACLLVALQLAGCKQPAEEVVVSPVDSLRTIVMDLHNVEMEKMGEMKMLERELKSAIEEADSLSDPGKLELLQQALTQLDSGDFAMKSWMRNWKEPDTLASIENQVTGLTQQHDSMKRTKELMQKGIDAAKLVLGHEE